MSENRRQLVASLAGCAAMLSLVVLTFGVTLVRVDVTDTPWHLATARLAFQTGQWPTRNTFSWTHPDYPLQQQYPVYQSMLYGAFQLGGFEGLSVFQATVWTAIFCLAVSWGGGWRLATRWPALWLLGLLGLQRRMTLRPDIATFLILIAMLFAIDLYRRGKVWSAALLVVLQWLFANAHQLFPIGIAIQGALLFELVAQRIWPSLFSGVRTSDHEDRTSPARPFFAGSALRLPIWPAAAAIALSCAACLLTPLGWQIVYTPLHTASSLSHHRLYLEEFRPIWTDAYAFNLALLCGLTAILSFLRTDHAGLRRPIVLFDALVWLLAGALAASAVRGAALFCIVSIAVAFRQKRERSTLSPAPLAEALAPSGSARKSATFSILLSLGVLTATCWLLDYRWHSHHDRNLMAFQPGVGKWRGWWPSDSIRFLREHPPPGRMFNLGWFAANALIWELQPTHPVFVDPRFEAYPRDFLLESIAAEDNAETLDRLLDEFQPMWIVGEIRLPSICAHAARLTKNDAWRLVSLDDVFFVLVRNVPATARYLAELEQAPEDLQTSAIDESSPEVACFQHLRLAMLYSKLADAHPLRTGLRRRADEELQIANRLGENLRSFAAALEELRRADP